MRGQKCWNAREVCQGHHWAVLGEPVFGSWVGTQIRRGGKRSGCRLMPKHELEYRGYKIWIEAEGRSCVVTVTPKTSELPILPWNSFHAPSEQDALAEAQRRVDRLLAPAQ
jgi:hypothetical protein